HSPLLSHCYRRRRALRSFPTRRSSDLIQAGTADMVISGETLQNWAPNAALMAVPYAFRDLDHVKSVVEGDIGEQIKQEISDEAGDRKSTRLNSSHVKISYAVFCLKKKR